MSGDSRKPAENLSIAARAYLATTMVLGVASCIHGLAESQSEIPARLIWYLILGLMSSGLKVSLPGIVGTLSVNFLFILFGLAELHLGETMLIGCSGALLQSVWKTTARPKFRHVGFSVCSVATAVCLSYRFYHSHAAGYISSGANAVVLLPVAAAIYFLSNTLPVASIVALSERKRLSTVWKECYFWFLPYYLVGASIVCVLHWVNGILGWQISFLVLPVFYLMYRSYRSYLGRLEAEKKHVEEVNKLQHRTIQALALAIEAKDQTTHNHLQRVQVYALEIGKELNMNSDQLDALRAASLLHDIGKLAVPEHIISKPGKLTAEEFEKMKIHPSVGAEILEEVEFPYPVVPIVRSHHEKWDGSGYPDGLKGEEIPLGARILSAVDCLDALASDRQYRRALPLDQAMAVIASESGKAYDPEVIAVLERRYEELEKLARANPAIRRKLARDVKVERGLAPASGFEAVTQSGDETKQEGTFLAQIAGARQEAQVLFELAQELGNSLSLNETLSLLAERLRPIVPYDAIAIYECRDDRLFPVYVSGTDRALFASLEIPVGEGLSGWVAQNRKPIINGNPSVEPGFLGDPTKFSTLRSALSVPLEGVNLVAGVLTLYRMPADAFSRDNLRILLAISSKVGLSLENALKYSQLENSATTDFLTGLPNARSLFLALDAQLSRSARSGETLTVLVCDLDGFKQINDRYGHLEGNRVLQEFARRVRNDLRASDCVARMGGDEFVLVLPGLDSQAQVRIIEWLNRVAVEVGQRICGVNLLSASVGDAKYPTDGQDAESLLTHADRRMYKTKQDRKSKGDFGGVMPEIDPNPPELALR
jgi:diguanylate cyclase (GGDEF)-like protein/putative nucleotidyltransferase with HDIG domain